MARSLTPALGGAIAAGGKQPMNHGQIDGSLDVKLVASRRQGALDDFSQLEGFP